jgi:hypothetical protein
LFVDAVESAEQNYARVLEYVTGASVALEPLQVNVPLVKGQYHQYKRPDRLRVGKIRPENA